MNVTATAHNFTSPDESPSLLAWAGWQLNVPGDWRPLKLSGTSAKGWMIVGDAMCAMFSVHWEQPQSAKVADAKAWTQERLKRMGLQPDPDPPAADQFSACVWAHGVQSEQEKQTTYWYGYAEPAKLLVGVKVNGVLPEEHREQVTGHVLPSLRATPADTESTWAMHDVCFVVPPGFQLLQRHLFVGDVALEFENAAHETLLLRQVYPGDLALDRRKAEHWLSVYPFKEHRRIRKRSVITDPWRDPVRTELSGVRRVARKCLGFPLGMVAARWSDALAVHDTSLNRLLIAEHMVKSKPDGSVCVRAVKRMNGPLREAR